MHYFPVLFICMCYFINLIISIIIITGIIIIIYIINFNQELCSVIFMLTLNVCHQAVSVSSIKPSFRAPSKIIAQLRT